MSIRRRLPIVAIVLVVLIIAEPSGIRLLGLPPMNNVHVIGRLAVAGGG